MTTKKNLTLKGVQAELRAVFMVLTKRDGEYRVNIRGGSEATAAYDNDLESIRGTGFAMARHRDITLDVIADGFDEHEIDAEIARRLAEPVE